MNFKAFNFRRLETDSDDAKDNDNKSPAILTVNKESHDDWEGCIYKRRRKRKLAEVYVVFLI